MAKALYIGVNNVARKVKAIYIGVNNIAKEVKMAYIGVSNYARVFYSYIPTSIMPLSVARHSIGATTIGNYALFAGGTKYEGDKNYPDSSLPQSTVDAYSIFLTHSNPSALSVARVKCGTVTLGNYALFAGGFTSLNGIYSESKVVDAYSTSLTRSAPFSLSVPRAAMKTTTIGNYALFAGGTIENNKGDREYSDMVEAYNTSLTRSVLTPLNGRRVDFGATTVGNYALFGGGSETIVVENGILYDSSNAVDAYNTALTRSTPTVLSYKRNSLDATTIGNYALFAGGYVSRIGENPEGGTDVVDAYNASLTRSTPTSLSVKRYDHTAITIGNYALFAGGLESLNWYSYDSIDAYNASLTRSTPMPLSVERNLMSATVVGDYVIFGGGAVWWDWTEFKESLNTVDAYNASLTRISSK